MNLQDVEDGDEVDDDDDEVAFAFELWEEPNNTVSLCTNTKFSENH